MKTILHWIISALAVIVASYILPGVHVTGFVAALILALVLGLINAVIRPILKLLTLPLNILTLGLFGLVINALMVMLADKIVPGFAVDGFLWAFIFAIVLAIVSSIFHMFERKEE
ncbi:phage holin family protein [soil metagenome]